MNHSLENCLSEYNITNNILQNNGHIMAMKAYDISVIVPLYNEEKRLEQCLSDIYEYFDKYYRNRFELILINDGSNDKTEDIIVEYSKDTKNVLINSYRNNRGKGFALKKGVEIASGEYIFFTDIDLSTPIHYFERLYNTIINTNADAVLGDRRSNGSIIKERQSFIRSIIGNTYYNIAFPLIGLDDVKDSNCGFKIYRNEMAKYIFSKMRTDRWVFDVELLLIAQLHNYKLQYSPVQWAHKGGTKVNVVIDSIRSLRDLLLVFIWKLMGRYN